MASRWKRRVTERWEAGASSFRLNFRELLLRCHARCASNLMRWWGYRTKQDNKDYSSVSVSLSPPAALGMSQLWIVGFLCSRFYNTNQFDSIMHHSPCMWMYVVELNFTQKQPPTPTNHLRGRFIPVPAPWHYNNVIMGVMAYQITSLTIVYSTVCSGADQRKHQSSASLAFVRGIHRWPVNSPLLPVNSPQKWPVTWY